VRDGDPMGRSGAGECEVCGRRSPLISRGLGLCGECIRNRPEQAMPVAAARHVAARETFALPERPPKTPGGVPCPLCSRACVVGAGERGFCALREGDGRRLRQLAGVPARGLVHWYRDPLPTNCVADWVCGGSGHRGRHNLAVFYASCTLDCLFCQNWHFREDAPTDEAGLSSATLADAANDETHCVCFFGGDPASQMPHALDAARRLAERGTVVCWETAGTSHPRLLDRALEISLVSGGCVKFDLKAHDEALHVALTGASNRRTLENFARAASGAAERRRPPLVIASTLLVPGYVDAREVGRIARFIAGIDPETPYALLGFAPHFFMRDLPVTSRAHAEAAEAAARDAGLRNVRIGNRHLLSAH
jgi:pyruvate formate lyase activating enzyme